MTHPPANAGGGTTSDGDALLRGMLAAPDEPAPRLVYADWLDERGDPRAALLRTDWDARRLCFLDWVAGRGNLDFYLHRHPELRDELPHREANVRWRELSAGVADRDWVAAVDTLGRPFRPFFFWNNTGPRSFADGELPFREAIGTRGPVVTFESAFFGEAAWQPELAEDLDFLCGLAPLNCYSGATSSPIHPFACEFPPATRLTGVEVLRALRASRFRSEHIGTLDATAIPHPGYHPSTDNDSVHTDTSGQMLFPRPHEFAAGGLDDDPDGVGRWLAVQDGLRAAVTGGVLWYVLLHAWAGDGTRGPWVVLFAVGRSRRGDRLIGVVSHQMCHNLCD